MTRKKQGHTHQYQRTYPYGKVPGPLGNSRSVWACALPDCNHFVPLNMIEPVDKLSLCNNCFEVFQLTRENMKLDKPICEKCSNPNAVKMPEDFDMERFETKSRIAKTRGIALEDVTEEEIDRMLQFNRLRNV